MGISDIILGIEKVSKDIDKFISSKGNILSDSYDDIIGRYEALTIDLMNSEELPDCVAEYLCGNDFETVELPKEYSSLACIDKLAKYSLSQARKKIKEKLKLYDFNEAVKFYMQSVRADKKNSILLYQFESFYKKIQLYSELLEIYKIIFSGTYDPKSCEKIGDVYTILKDYEKAIEYYLNVIELTGRNQKIFLKLAKIFKILNDMDSYNTCMMQAQEAAGVNEL